MKSQTTTIDTEDAIRLFTDAERRRIVAALVDHPEDTVSLRDLAIEVSGGPSPRTTGPSHDTALASLKHDHLPRMDDIGVIQYDWRSETVRYHRHERVERLLEFIRTELE